VRIYAWRHSYKQQNLTTESVSIPVSRSALHIISEPTASNELSSPEIVVAGSLAVDYSCDFNPLSTRTDPASPVMKTSNPARINLSLGGVGYNINKAAHFLGRRVSLCTLIGNDLPGKVALNDMKSIGMSVDNISTHPEVEKSRTAQYVAVNDFNKELFIAMADMAILEKLPITVLDKWTGFLKSSKPQWFVGDANLDSHSLTSLFKSAKSANIKTAFEPVSTAKSTRLFTSSGSSPLPVYPNHFVDLSTPNSLELTAMCSSASSAGLFDHPNWFPVVDAFGIPSSGIQRRLVDLTTADLVSRGIPQQVLRLLPFIPTILTKLGAKGVLLTSIVHKDDTRLLGPDSYKYILSRTNHEDPTSPVGGVYMRYFPTPESIPDGEIVSVNGVGDTFLGALLSRMIATQGSPEDAVDFAQQAAAMTLRSSQSVSAELRHLASGPQ
jgi:pseudouridine-5'-phosphate glycosidase/pseudouridine kinase